MKRALPILLFGLFGISAEVQAAQCSSYYISEINIVSVADTDAGNVQTYVGFGQSREDSDRTSGRNALSDSADNSLHLKYTKAVKRVTGCS